MLRTLLSTEGPRLHIVRADGPVHPASLSLRRGRRPRRPVSARLLFRSVGADDPVRPVPLSFRRGQRPRRPVSARLLFRSVEAGDFVRPVPLSFRASARTGVGIRFPLPPSARDVAARSADGGSDIARQFLSPSRPRRQPPPSGGLAARRCRADGTSYPKGICSAALHGRTPSPTGGSTHLPRRAARPQATVYPQAVSSTVQRSKASCHGMVPQASRTALFRTRQNPATFVAGFRVGATYLPRPSPAKYCQQKRA